MQSRWIGIVLIIGGLALGWFTVLSPLQEAYAGAQEVRYYIAAFLLVPFLVLFGIGMLFGGTQFVYRDTKARKLSSAGWILFAIAVGLAAIGYLWFQQQFSALGYT